MRGVYEHPPGSGIWWAQYFTAGKRHRERAGSKSNAITLYRKRKTEALTTRKLPELTRRHVTLGELMDDAIAFARQHHKAPRDVEQKAATARPKLGQLWADSVTHEDLAGWIDARGVDRATFNRYKSFFSLCYREGQRAGKVKDNPARLIRRRRESSGRKRFLTHAEYTTILAAIDAKIAATGKPRQVLRWRNRRAMFVASVYTGMRLGEQTTLEVPQVDFARNEIRLDETKNGDSREIPMVPEVVTALRELIGARSSGLVHQRERGGSGAVDLDWFQDLLRELGIGEYSWHNNRHTFCSWLAIAGKPLKTIQELAGHRTIQTTAKYAHLTPNRKRADLEDMAAGLRKTQPITERARKRS